VAELEFVRETNNEEFMKIEKTLIESQEMNQQLSLQKNNLERENHDLLS
jgi:hypothetical protein